MAKPKEVEATQEVAAVEEVEATQEVAAVTSGGAKTYVKTIKNAFEVKGFEIPDGEFDLSDINLDDDQTKAFNHAIVCGIIKEVN